MNDKALAVSEETKSTNIIQIIEKVAFDPNVDVEKMERLLNMQERIMNKEAELDFSRDMSECQAEMPTVVRDSVNPQTHSKYAKFETIVQTIKPCYTKHGFAISFGTQESPVDKHIRITADLMHRSGCTKPFFVDLPLDIAGLQGKANKTEIHATGSTHSYGKRYLIGMIFNIAIADQDDDAVAAGAITVQDLLENNAAVRELFTSIAVIKAALFQDDYSTAYEAMAELTNEEKGSLRRAPTKGGIFTTDEIKQMKSDGWAAAAREFRGDSE